MVHRCCGPWSGGSWSIGSVIPWSVVQWYVVRGPWSGGRVGHYRPQSSRRRSEGRPVRSEWLSGPVLDGKHWSVSTVQCPCPVVVWHTWLPDLRVCRLVAAALVGAWRCFVLLFS